MIPSNELDLARATARATQAKQGNVVQNYPATLAARTAAILLHHQQDPCQNRRLGLLFSELRENLLH